MTTLPADPPQEQAVCLSCEGETLLGVLHHPQRGVPRHPVGVLVVVGGPQYRAGSHRQFVLLARHLAAAGHAVLRFDVRGMGDSTGQTRNFEQLSPDIAAALDSFAAHAPGLERFVLWGLCDGASAALLYLDESADPRVQGLCLVNPWVRTADSHARTTLRHYYLRRLLQADFWRKLLRGGVARSALRDLDANLRAARSVGPTATHVLPFHERMQRALSAFNGPVLLLMSGKDYTAREFDDRAAAELGWRKALAHPRVTREDLPDADHTFSDDTARQAAEARTLAWLRQGWRQP
jgi:exosortase A-associated hydrolase 1